MGFEIGDLVKVAEQNRVFRLEGFTDGSKTIPEGWLVDERGFSVNPKFCKKYNGATSCLEQHLSN